MEKQEVEIKIRNKNKNIEIKLEKQEDEIKIRKKNKNIKQELWHWNPSILSRLFDFIINWKTTGIFYGNNSWWNTIYIGL